jgi:hypothetical protein
MARRSKISQQLTDVENMTADLENPKLDSEDLESDSEDLESDSEDLESDSEDLETDYEDSETYGIINMFYESLRIPYCRVCGEKEIKDFDGNVICSKNQKNCEFK